MSTVGSYPTRDFSESQKFLVLNPDTQSLSLVLGRDLVEYITPQSTYVFAEQSRAVAQNEDYQLGALIQTAGDLTAGDNFAGTFLVVPGGDGDFPMANGNDLLIIKGDILLREQLASNASTEGSDLVAHTGTSDTVTEALDKRTIYVGSVAELEALSLAAGTAVYLTQDGRAGEFVVKAGTPPSDPQKGVYIVLANGNYAERKFNGQLVYPEWFGAANNGALSETEVHAWWDFARDNNLTPAIGGREAVYKYTTPLTSSSEQDIHVVGTGGTLYGTGGAFSIGDELAPAPERRIRFRTNGVSFKADDGAACIEFKEFVADWIIEDAIFDGGWYHVDMVDALIGEFKGCVFQNSTIASSRGRMLNYSNANIIIYENCKYRGNVRIHDFDGGSVLLRNCDVENNHSGASYLCRYVNMGGGGSGVALCFDGMNWFEGNTGAGDVYFRGVNNQRQVVMTNPKFISDTTRLLDFDTCTVVINGGSANTTTATDHLVLGSNTYGVINCLSFTPAKLINNGHALINYPGIESKTIYLTDVSFGDGNGIDLGLPGSADRASIKGISGANLLIDYGTVASCVFQTGGTNKFRILQNGSIGVSGVVTAGIPGAINKYFPIYDQNGSFVGNVPIYN